MLPFAPLLLAAVTACAGEVATSSAPARVRARAPEPDIPWTINYGIDRRGRRVGFDYNIRWDPAELFGGERAPRQEGHQRAETLEDWAIDLLSSTRLDLYGVRVKPFRSRPLPPAPVRQDFHGQDGSAASPPPSTPARRSLRLEPLADLQRNARRELERFLIREGFDSALPRAAAAPYWQKEAVSRSLIDANASWNE